MVPSLKQYEELDTDSKNRKRTTSLVYYLVSSVLISLSCILAVVLFNYLALPFLYSILVLVIYILSAVWLIYSLNRKLYSPLKRMRLEVARYAKGDFGRYIPESGLKEINQLVRSLNRMQERIRHLEEVRSDFVANVSHELKTPITSCLLYTSPSPRD